MSKEVILLLQLLQGDGASKQKIQEALKNVAQEVKNDSVVFLYYSGHGVYLPDSQDEGLLPTVTSWPPTVNIVSLYRLSAINHCKSIHNEKYSLTFWYHQPVKRHKGGVMNILNTLDFHGFLLKAKF